MNAALRLLCAATLACAIVIAPTAFAAPDRDTFLVDGVTYDPAYPTPEAFIGHRLGEAPVRYYQLVEYLRLIGEKSPRMTVEVIGHSYEGRPLLTLVVTAPENQARLEAIRQAHIALTEPGSGGAVDAAMPVVTWLNYGVHGAEASGMDAVLPTVYQLAAATGAAIEKTLRESVIVITAAFNPDGHSRRAAWYDSYLSKEVITDPAHRLHSPAWPGNRTNHYWFDLNRQWLLQTQPESQAWMRQWHKWRPNVSVDYHEMGPNQTYYFHPGITSRTNPNVPAEAIELMNAFSESPAAFMDSEARLYFNQERYDNFYIGKGSTYPLVNGAVGILFEAASGRGRAVESDNGIRTYRDNIRTHFRTSLASIEGARRLRARLLDYQKRFYDGAIAAADKDPVKAWVVSAGPDRSRLFHFLQLMGRHRIEVRHLAKAVRVDGETFEPSDSALIVTRQAQYRMIKAVFERITEFDDHSFYDVSAFTLPLAFNLRHAALNTREMGRGAAGPRFQPKPADAAAPDKAPYAYMIGWNDYYAARALNRVLSAGLLARVATSPLSVETTRGVHKFGRGAIIIPLARQKMGAEGIYALMKKVAAEDGIAVYAIKAGRSIEDGHDLGSPSYRSLKAPHPLLLVGGGIRSYDAGEVWHLLDRRMAIPLSLHAIDRLKGVNLGRYTHIILPGGNYRDVAASLGERLGRWVDAGGTVIAIRQGAKWAEKTLFSTAPPGDEKSPAKDDVPDKKEKVIAREDYVLKDTLEAEKIIGGAIFGSDLDITHPLGFGFAWRAIASQRDTTLVLKKRQNPFATVAVYKDKPLLAGYAAAANRRKIAGTPMLVAERRGKGSIILFADDPNFRGIFYGTNRLFLNALFFSTAFDAPRR